MKWIWPWPRKHERRAEIDAARAEKERSRRRAVEAKRLEDTIQRIVEENHFAALIREQLLAGHNGGGRR